MDRRVNIAFEMTLKDATTEQELIDLLVDITAFFGMPEDAERLKAQGKRIIIRGAKTDEQEIILKLQNENQSLRKALACHSNNGECKDESLPVYSSILNHIGKLLDRLTLEERHQMLLDLWEPNHNLGCS